MVRPTGGRSKFHTNWFADTIEDFSFTCTSGSLSLAVVGQNTQVMDSSEPVSSAGMIEQRVLLKCFSGASNQGLSLAFTNANSSALTN
jgi:hypothetical protein